jgi:hypothetical protein
VGDDVAEGVVDGAIAELERAPELGAVGVAEGEHEGVGAAEQGGGAAAEKEAQGTGDRGALIKPKFELDVGVELGAVVGAVEGEEVGALDAEGGAAGLVDQIDVRQVSAAVAGVVEVGLAAPGLKAEQRERINEREGQLGDGGDRGRRAAHPRLRW